MKNKGGGIVQFLQFALVGVSNTAIDWIVFKLLVLTVLTGSDILAKAISFSISVLNSYLWNTIWTFKKEYKSTVGQKNSSRISVFVRFVVVSVVGLGINVLIYDLTAKYVGYKIFDKDLIPLFFASGSAVIWNFAANKFWTYQR